MQRQPENRSIVKRVIKNAEDYSQALPLYEFLINEYEAQHNKGFPIFEEICKVETLFVGEFETLEAFNHTLQNYGLVVVEMRNICHGKLRFRFEQIQLECAKCNKLYNWAENLVEGKCTKGKRLEKHNLEIKNNYYAGIKPVYHTTTSDLSKSIVVLPIWILFLYKMNGYDINFRHLANRCIKSRLKVRDSDFGVEFSSIVKWKGSYTTADTPNPLSLNLVQSHLIIETT